MTQQIVPLAQSSNQTVSVALGGQACQITLTAYEGIGMFASLYVAGDAVFLNVPCRDRVGLVQREYLDFSGELMFMDTQGTSDPEYAGLNDRWLLVYSG
ncbi:hypothetical protein NBRC3280_3418 [Acetobacter pasteurianus NBRC 3280]|uniref:Cyanophage baseplate Pam3 plug gp18 domain-containing protein n=1 Tax=Acetobacter pasteurianus NBRC 3278 TaxID=1226660 RepID=A0A401X999_ACEPA|nr:hypothetical protein [Acetobacter pasteurianus]GCD60846.1 hypothetical protein NBRC3277_3421 [Acetobacter pasteurianus NBRC 3277]GCD64450.1 hypothetical protein NBRC3278_3543 [Acetobacter pasteurianus NBRC 3278]GCD70783.1 hypothetical protein NBRC3280_3418 [Acetobacter pasteurianus NBRC 3280]